MLKIKKILLSIALITPYAMEATSSSSSSCDSSSSCASACTASSCSGTTCATSRNLWQPHAFSNYASREILLMKGLDFESTENNWINRIGAATEYMQNFSDNALGAMPFWSGNNQMTIGNHDGKADLDAFQFGMGNVNTIDSTGTDTGIAGTITFAPKVQHVGTELLWFDMQNKKHGVYFKVKAPLGAMRITSKICQTPIELATTDVVNRNSDNAYFLPALRFATLGAALQGGTMLQDPLYSYGKLASCPQTAIRFGDISAAIGVNILSCEDKLFAIGAKFSGPTGNTPKAVYMLEPIFGRAGHWGVGGEVFGQYTYHLDNNNCDKERCIRVWYQGEIMHLFSGRQPSWRSFDLEVNGKGSKYLLLQHYYNDPADGDSTTPTYVSDYVIPAINVTTLPVKSSFDIEGNFALSIDYRRDCWNVAVVGELWGRTKENLKISCCANDYVDNMNVDHNLNNYAVLGRQTMQIVADATTTTWCQPNATINTSLDEHLGDMTTTPADGIKNGALAEYRINANYNTALDICGAAAKSIYTGKVLGEIGYTWKDNCHVPNLSVFGGAELPNSQNGWPRLWSVGLQGSLQF